MTESTLPYQLTEGVNATQKGLIIEKDHPLYSWVKLSGSVKVWPLDDREPYRVWKWPEAAERLCYQEGEPWCWYWPEFDCVRNEPASSQGMLDMSIETLHRLAAILCDGPEAFQVLHWCIHNLGEEQNNET